jgi:hypothetical protein
VTEGWWAIQLYGQGKAGFGLGTRPWVLRQCLGLNNWASCQIPEYSVEPSVGSVVRVKFREKCKGELMVWDNVSTYPWIGSVRNPVLGSCFCPLLPTNMYLPWSVLEGEVSDTQTTHETNRQVKHLVLGRLRKYIARTCRYNWLTIHRTCSLILL